jgi:SulP family sulfate permease
VPSLSSYLGRPQRGDLLAGVSNALVYLPQGIGYALVSGVNPIYGLYTGVLPPILGGLVSGSVFMQIIATNELAVPSGHILRTLRGQDAATQLFTLTLLVGVFALAAGVLRLGGLVRFISNAVMTGFVTGIMVLLILSQVPNLVGYRGPSSGNDARTAFEIFADPRSMEGTTVVVGVATIVALALLRLTRLRELAYLAVMVVASGVVAWLGLPSVLRTGSQHSIRAGLPAFAWPDWSAIPSLLVPALSLTIIGLSFGAGVSQAYPNPGGRPADSSRDFVGQGLANLVSAFFQCMPSAGSMSRTAYLVETGARTRWANLITGATSLVVVATVAGLAEQVPLAVVGALLVVLGWSAIDVGRIRLVWRVSGAERVVMGVTLILSVAVSPQMAILVGVLLSLAEFVWTSAQVQVTRLEVGPDGRIREEQASPSFRAGAITALRVHGCAYFASIEVLDQHLEAALSVRQTGLVLSIREYASLGSTGVIFFQRFAQRMQAAGNLFVLADVAPRIATELRATRVMEIIGPSNVFVRQQPESEETVLAAMTSARSRLSELPAAAGHHRLQ